MNSADVFLFVTLQVVTLLNDLYTCFDAIIDNFDVYKVTKPTQSLVCCLFGKFHLNGIVQQISRRRIKEQIIIISNLKL